MNRQQRYRLRVQTCIGTIIDVHKTVNIPREKEGLLSQFEDFKRMISHMDMSHVSEQDVCRVEQATNALLGEFRPVFESGVCGPLYTRQAH
jgi:trimethylamine:corrinoid methyltransferase-like protein